MSKRTHFTTVTALPAGITRETVMTTLHSHTEMIDLNPLVTERHPIRPPQSATAEESHCQWYSISDKISYLPGVHGSLTFMGCFHDLPDGLQTHILAPMGLDMKGRWTLGGSLPGEPRQAQELGLGVPKQGLWLREDVEMRCNFAMTRFVRKTTEKAHSTLVDRLVEKAHIKEGENYNERLEGASFVSDGSTTLSGGGGPPGYDHRHSSDIGGLVNPSAPMLSPRMSSFTGSDTGMSQRTSTASQSPRPSQYSPTIPHAIPHPAYTHQQLQHQQPPPPQQQPQTPTGYPLENKHPYEPATAYQQTPYLPDQKCTQFIDPYSNHPAMQQQQQQQHQQQQPHQQVQRPHYHLQDQPLSYKLASDIKNSSASHDPSLYPPPLKYASQDYHHRASGSQQLTNVNQAGFAIELPGGEATTPTELEGGR